MDFWRNEWEAVADTSEVADIKGVWQKPNRPKWEDVYAGYPKNEDGTDDRNNVQVFIEVFGDKYDSANNVIKNTNISLYNSIKTNDTQSDYYGSKGMITLETLRSKIGNRNGIYIVIPYAGCPGWSNITGHATLWVGKNRNVVGGHHYAHIIGELYFGELL